jgi:hypothetical protein
LGHYGFDFSRLLPKEVKVLNPIEWVLWSQMSSCGFALGRVLPNEVKVLKIVGHCGMLTAFGGSG